MNFVGNLDPNEVSSHSGGPVEVGPHHGATHTITIPDANLLFTGDFKRSGSDLILSKDGHDLVVSDYFKGSTRAALASPDGAQLTGSIVDALTGHVEYAQAGGGPAAATVIGHVSRVAGSATAIRNGVAIELHMGDTVNKGDVIQAASDSSLGLTFIDGTVFGLSSNARMVLNDMVYDPNGSSNSSLLSLVQGTITFVAGETAKHGDMKVNTPVATMGIRGTAVLVEIDFQVPGQGGAPPVKFQVLAEPGGHVGDYILYSLNDPNVAIGEVNAAGQVTSVNGSGDTFTSPAPPLSPIAQDIIQHTWELYFPNYVPPNPNPRGTGPNGSTPANPVPGSSNPNPLKFTPSPDLPPDHPTTVPISLPDNNPFGQPTVIPVTITVFPTINVTPVPVVNKAAFLIGDQVTISDSNPSDTLVPYVPGTAKIISVVGPANGPSQADLEKLLTLDLQTGLVSYNPANFAFLTENQKVVITIGFETSAGSTIFQETLTETINGVKHAPVISSANIAVVEGGTVVLKASDFVVTDPDTSNFTFTVSNVAHGAFQTTTDGVHWVNATTFTTADLNDGHVRFVQDGSTVAPTFSIQADDGLATNHLSTVTPGSASLDLPPVIVPPQAPDPGPIHAPTGTPDGHGGYAPVVLTNTFGFTDADFFDSHIVTATFDAGASNLGPLGAPIGLFALNLLQDSTGGNQGLVSWSFTLSSTDLQNIDNTNFLPAGSIIHEVFDVIVDDGHGGTAERQVSIEIDGPAAAANHVAPVVDPGTNHVVPYHLGAGGVAVDAGLTISDVDSATLQSATIAIENFQSGDTLIFANTLGITGSFNTETGVLTLTGSDTVANYQAALESISYQNLNPDAPTTDRTISFQVNDGSASNPLSNVGTATVSVQTDVDHWINPGGGDWNSGNPTGDWSTGQLPTAAVDVVIDAQPSPYAVTVSQDTTVHTLAIAAGVTLDIQHGSFAANGALTNHGNILLESNTTLEASGAIHNSGTITIDPVASPGATLLIDGIVTLDGGGTVSLDGSDDSITGVTTEDTPSTLENVDNVINGFGKLGDGHLHLINDDGGTIDATGLLTLDTGGTIKNAGLLEATDEGTLDLQDSKIDNTGSILIDATSTLLVDAAHLRLTGGGDVSLESGLIADPGIDAVLDNVSDTILGFGTIGTGDGELKLHNHHDGIIDATGGTLVIDTGSTIKNAGLLEATDSGTLDVQDGKIDNTGSIVIDSTSTLMLDTAHLRLTGGGDVSLEGGLIAAGTDFCDPVLDNIDNTISGRGTIGTGHGELKLHNQSGGTVDATDGTLTLDTGSTIENAGLLEATNHGTLDIQDDKIDNSGAGISHGIVIDSTSTLLVDTAHLRLTGGGVVSLEGGTIAAGAASCNPVLDNIDNTISGSGTIGTGHGQLKLHNDSGGTIDATGTLVLDTGNTIINHGLLEATGGGTLDIADSIHNAGSGANGILVGEASKLLVDSSVLRLSDGGTVSMQGGQITENAANSSVTASGAVLALDNIDNTISGSGEIGSGTVEYHGNAIGSLALTNGPHATIDARGGTLTIDTGHTIINTGLLEATTGGTLVVDDAVTGTGSEAISDGGVLEFLSRVDRTQTVTFKGAGTLYLAQPDSFKGEIAGISASDTMDLAGFDASKTSVTASYNEQTNTTTLHVADASDDQSVNLTLAGDHHADNFAIASDGNNGTLLVLNQETPTPVTSDSQSFTTTTSQVYQTHGAIGGGGLSIASSDNNSSDLIVAELDHASSIFSSTGHDGIHFTSLAAGIAIFNAATTISGSGSDSVGIFADGDGNVTIGDEANTTVSGGQFGIEAIEGNSNTANVDVNVGPNATIDSTSSYGILAINNGAGNISVRTAASDFINSGSTGIAVFNEAATACDSMIVVNASGTINSGSGVTGSGNPPAGISAGYVGDSSDPPGYPVPGLHGDVIVNSTANINASAGDGIRAYNYGTGNVTVNDDAGTITALGGSSPTNGFVDGISANVFGPGNIDVFTAADAIIHSGGSGILADNNASASPSDSEVSVLAYGTITSGAIPSEDGSPAAGILAGYNANESAEDNVHGNVVIDDYALITASAAGTDGIRGYNYGTGTVTVIAEAPAVITADRYGLAARGHDGGDVSVTNYGTVTADTAIDATTTTGNVAIDNHGLITGNIVVGDSTFAGHATVVNEFGAFWHLDGSSTFAGTSQLINDGFIDTAGTSSITTSGALTFNNAEVVNIQSGSLDVGAAVTGSGVFNISGGAQLEFGASVSAGQMVTFQDSTGTLKLDDPMHFAGQISGLSDGDGIDLANFDANQTVITRVSTDTSTVLTVTDEHHTVANGTAASITLQGSYTNSVFNFSNDHNGGALIVDSTVVAATGINSTLTGTGPSDTFVFDFANVGQATVTNFHADTDLLQIKSAIFANAQAILDATRDDGHGNSVIALDAHDSITLTGVAKAQLHQTDFHLV